MIFKRCGRSDLRQQIQRVLTREIDSWRVDLSTGSQSVPLPATLGLRVVVVAQHNLGSKDSDGQFLSVLLYSGLRS